MDCDPEREFEEEEVLSGGAAQLEAFMQVFEPTSDGGRLHAGAKCDADTPKRVALIVRVEGKVYDLTDFEHPGKKESIANLAGKDGTEAFLQNHASGTLPHLRRTLAPFLQPRALARAGAATAARGGGGGLRRASQPDTGTGTRRRPGPGSWSCAHAPGAETQRRPRAA